MYNLPLIETLVSSDPGGILTIDSDPEFSSSLLSGRNRQMTRMESSLGASPPSSGTDPGKSMEDILMKVNGRDLTQMKTETKIRINKKKKRCNTDQRFSTSITPQPRTIFFRSQKKS
jgi:hypothetical protein